MKKLTNHFPKIRLSTLTKRLLKSRMFLQNFICLMSILMVIFFAFAMIIFSQSRRVIRNEFITASQYKLEETAQAIDQHIMDIRYIIASLDTNTMVRAMFTFNNPENLYNDYYVKVQEVLKAYVNGFPSIDSIYLYSEYTDTILTNIQRVYSRQFDDTGWMHVLSEDILSEDSIGFKIFFRSMYDRYPHVLCVMKQFEIDGYQAAVVININLSNLTQLTEFGEDSYQSVYLVSDDGELLFRNGQKTATESLDTIPELENFQSDTDYYTELIESKTSPYTYTQIHSEKYPWSYVMVTYLQEYTSRLSSFQALFITIVFALFCAVFLLSFFVSMRSIKPIRNLIELFQNPEGTLSKEIYSDGEIGYIADQVTSYIQTNQALTDELSARLNLLNQTKLLALQSQINPHFLFNSLNMIYIQESEVLGYDHRIPKLTADLSRLLRYAIESTDLVPLETELEFTKMYINILRERYNNKPCVIYNIDQTTFHAKVPKLFIQPIIENAVFHGLAEHMNEHSTLTLSCHLAAGYCMLSVKDNGVGMKPETLENLRETLKENVPLKNSIGIKNVVTRMNLLYGEDFTIKINSSVGNGTEFILSFPFRQQ